jgi:alpha-L-fucosidase
VEPFDTDVWAERLRTANARYVVSVAEHYDGLALADSRRWQGTAVHMGSKNGIIEDLPAALRRQGIFRGMSSHRVEHGWLFNSGKPVRSTSGRLMRQPLRVGIVGEHAAQ